MTETTAIQILSRGDPLPNGAVVRVKHSDIAWVQLDMATKRCAVFTFGDRDGTPEFTLSTTEATPVIGLTDNMTTCSFPEFAGWEIKMAECVRYTASFLLTKDVE